MTTKQANSIIISAAYILSSELSSYTDNGKTVAVTLAAGKAWKPIFWQPLSSTFEQTSEPKAAGIVYNQNIVTVIPGDEETQQQQLEYLRNRPLIVRLTYDNGKIKYIGSPGVPAFLITDFVSAKFAQKNTVQFMCQAASPARFAS